MSVEVSLELLSMEGEQEVRLAIDEDARRVGALEVVEG